MPSDEAKRGAIEVIDPQAARSAAEEEIVTRAVQEAEGRLYERRRELLLSLVEDEDLSSDDLFTMVRLGIVTLEDNLLPCKDLQRANNAADWDIEFEEFLVQAKQGQPHPVRPSQYMCPIMSAIHAADRPLPCVEARAHQRERCCFRDNPEAQQRLEDPDDPVVETELRPCLILGNETISAILSPIYRKKHRAERRRKETEKKPKA